MLERNDRFGPGLDFYDMSALRAIHFGYLEGLSTTKVSSGGVGVPPRIYLRLFTKDSYSKIKGIPRAVDTSFDFYSTEVDLHVKHASIFFSCIHWAC